MKKNFCILFLCIISISTYCQKSDVKNLINQITPIEPTSTSLGKYGLFPVSNSKGLIPINIPIYEIKSGDLSQIIELSYHGGGITVDEESSWVGLGWSLKYGGLITRAVYGFPDEEELSEVPDEQQIRKNIDSGEYNSNYYQELANSESGSMSFKPDIYYYDFKNNSGSFCVNKAIGTDILFMPHSSLIGKVNLDRIKLIDSKGNNYYFVDTEKTQIKGAKRKINPFCSSYSIDKIISPNNNDTISYEYQIDGCYSKKITTAYEGISETTNYLFNHPSNTSVVKIPEREEVACEQIVNCKKIKYIYFNGGRAVFNLSERNDLDILNNSLNKLDNIIIENKIGNEYRIIKYIKFYYSYYNVENINDLLYYNKVRLCLDSIVEYPSFNILAPRKLVAAFTYYGNKFLPDKDTNSFDFWGYYNGKHNTSKIPLTYYDNNVFGQADKSPDPSFAEIGSLKSIIYPTKGKTDYIWEGNRIYSTNPIYTKKNATVTVYSSNDPKLDCSKPIIPSPYDDDVYIGARFVKIHSDVNQTVRLRYDLYRENNISNQHNKYDKASISINGILITNKIEQYRNYHEIDFNLEENEDYTILIMSNCNNISGSISFSYEPSDMTDIRNYPLGGLRIKSVVNYDNQNKELSRRSYEYLNENGNSSGYLTNQDQLNHLSISESYMGTGDLHSIIYSKNIIVQSKHLSNFKASDYSYEFVKEKNVTDKNIGYTIYKYKTSQDILISNEIPSLSNDHVRTKAINITDYDNQNNKKKVIDYYYSIDERVHNYRRGFIMNKSINSDLPADYLMNFVDVKSMYVPMNYNYTTEWVKLDSTITIDYTEPQFSIKNKTNYTYSNENHMQPTNINTLTSKGEYQISQIKYSGDLNEGIYSEMKMKNMIEYPISIKKYTSNKKFLKGIYNTYTKDNYNNIILAKVSEYVTDNNMVDLYSYKYNKKQRLIESLDNSGCITAIYWDNYNLYPEIIVKNMSYSTLSGIVDKFRLNLSPSLFTDAQVTIYSYLPLIGLSSKTLPNGITFYYEYDKIGRLESVYTIKNNKKNIIKQFKYNFRN